MTTHDLTLVTGGAGFIGSHLCSKLLQDGHKVLAVDNLSTGRQQNLAHLAHHQRFHLCVHDLLEPLPKTISKLPVKQIYHLASPASPPDYQRDPIRTLLTNVLGAHHVLKLATAKNARVLLASTSEIYGDPEVHPQRENYCGNVDTSSPRACYDEGKRAAETLFFDYRRSYNLDIRIARIFNTYGPGMRPDDGRVISNLIVQALQGKPLSIYGEGRQTRSFCYVEDLVNGLSALMNLETAAPGAINLGNPEEFSIQELVKEIRLLLGKELTVHYHPLPQNDPRRRRPDITQAQKYLDWSPRIPLAEGLQKTAEYFAARLQCNNKRSPLKTYRRGNAFKNAAPVPR